MDKHPKRKSLRLNGDKRERIGIPLHIHDRYGNELFSGDEIIYNDERCVILWDKENSMWMAMLTRSCWYADKNKYKAQSYGKAYTIPMDNGARMKIERITL